MDLGLSEEQQMLQNSAREFLERECPTTLVREMEEDDRGYPTELWRQMGELGWTGVLIPEEYGGTGGSLTDFAVLLEEIGRFLAPTPLFQSVVLGGLTILNGGSDEQKKAYVPGIASGGTIATLALTEESAQYTPEAVAVQGQVQGDNIVINGTKLFVDYANVADYLITVVRTGSGASPEDGITVLVVDGKSPGITTSRLQTMARDHQCEVVFQNVSVPAANVLGQVGGGWPLVKQTLQNAAVMQCAEAAGGGRAVLERTVEYVRTRVQFGRPIGSFQAIQHFCANMVNEIDAARLATYLALARLEDGGNSDAEVAQAKALTNLNYKWATLQAHQMHGGIGFMQEYDLQLWTRRAKTMELKYGNTADHREAYAKAIGL
jgi:alkylation response protein AidB-like acyl-CoA dehydrogenase